jgi:hypothetical protein
MFDFTVNSTSPTGNKYHDFLRQYLLMISSTIGGKDGSALVVTCNVVPMLGPLITNQQIKPHILFQVVAVAFWAHWRNANSGLASEEEYVLDIICGILNSILIAAVGLFGAGDDMDEVHMNREGSSNNMERRCFCFPHCM